MQSCPGIAILSIMFVVPEPAIPAVAANCVFTILTFLTVIARIASRAFIVKKVGLDDWFMVGAMVSVFVKSGCPLY